MAKKLLLADDSITIQKVIGITFANEDYELTVVDNGADCVTKAKEIKPDLILADVVMPEKDGYQVCKEVKSDPQLAGIPIILLTGTFETFDEAKSKAVGADDYITKPFESQTLIDKVKAQLERGKTEPVSPPMSGGQRMEETPRPQPVSSAPIAAPAVEDIGKEEEIVDLGEDEIWDMAEEEPAYGIAAGAGVKASAEFDFPDETVSEPSSEAEDEWSIDEFEEVGGPAEEVIGEEEVLSGTEAQTEDEISDEELWGGMDFGEIEETPQVEERTDDVLADSPASSSVEDFADIDSGGLPSGQEELDSGAGEFFGFEDISDSGEEEAPAPMTSAPSEEDIFEFDVGMGAETEVLSSPEAPQAALGDTEPQVASLTDKELKDLIEEPAQAPEAVSADSVFGAAGTVSAPHEVTPDIAGISEQQLEAIVSKVAKEVIEKIAWEIVPELAETIIVEEIKRLKAKIGS